jgi:hypothetical protein
MLLDAKVDIEFWGQKLNSLPPGHHIPAGHIWQTPANPTHPGIHAQSSIEVAPDGDDVKGGHVYDVPLPLHSPASVTVQFPPFGPE